MEKEKFEQVEVIELFGKEYEILSIKNGYIKLKNNPMFIRGGVVYTPRGNTPLSLAQTDKIRHQMVRSIKEDTRTLEQRTNEDMIAMFLEE